MTSCRRGGRADMVLDLQVGEHVSAKNSLDQRYDLANVLQPDEFCLRQFLTQIFECCLKLELFDYNRQR